MHQRRSHLLIYSMLMAVAGIVWFAGGCNDKPQKPKTPIARYPQLPLRKVPPYLKDTIIERTELGDNRPYPVSGFGLVANLNGTGNSDAPIAVREYIIKDMATHKWGSKLLGPDAPNVSPDEALRDPRFAIVRVDGNLPPGVREGQTFDVQVAAIPEGFTTSLAHGDLYQTDLRIRGADNRDPGGSVNIFARCQGPIFVNPAYALEQNPTDPAAKRSLRYGIIMDGGRVMRDRPMLLRLLQPDLRVAPFIAKRINQRFQDIADRPRKSGDLSGSGLAEAQDEGTIHFYVPGSFRGDWEHFSGVVTHLYLNESPEFADMKARELAAEAVKPDARLMDISLAWEGLGPHSIPYLRDLASSEKPEIAFAAARAGAYLGDQTSQRALAEMARKNDNPFQLPAIQVLGDLPNSPAIQEVIRPMLDSNQTLVRLEAYRILAAHKDSSIFTKVVRNRMKQEPFALDIVRSGGPPLVYATSRGLPRIAIIGDRASLNLPIVFSTMGGRLTISSNEAGRTVTIFYRPPTPPNAKVTPPPVRIVSNPDLAEIVARLGGEADEFTPSLMFPYCDVVSILNEITKGHRVAAMSNGARVPATFMLQELPAAQDAIFAAPAIPDTSRPQTDAGENVGLAK